VNEEIQSKTDEEVIEELIEDEDESVEENSEFELKDEEEPKVVDDEETDVEHTTFEDDSEEVFERTFTHADNIDFHDENPQEEFGQDEEVEQTDDSDDLEDDKTTVEDDIEDIEVLESNTLYSEDEDDQKIIMPKKPFGSFSTHQSKSFVDVQDETEEDDTLDLKKDDDLDDLIRQILDEEKK
jgi:hypothetical protein